MEIKQLKIFLEVCRHMNITKAAKSMNYSQSSISDAIKKLEESTDSLLFERFKKRIYLTDKGKTLKPYAERIIKLHEEALASLISDKTVIHVGIIESLAAYIFPSFFREFMFHHDEVEINFIVVRCEKIVDLLKEKRIDFGLTLDELVIDSDIDVVPLFHEEICLVKSHLYDNTNYNAIDDLYHKNIIISKGYTGYNTLFFDFYKKHQIPAGRITYMETIEGMKRYVKDGFGITFLPRSAFDTEKNELEIIDIGYQFFHTVQLITLKDRPLKGIAEKLIDACIKKYRSS